jgi:2-dehydropantoate 2-reductase
MLQAMAGHGLALTDLDADPVTLPADRLQLHDAVPPGLAPDLVLLCVKSGATADAAATLGAALPPGTPVLSMQNGISNAEVAQAAAPGLVVLRGMVPFNVAELGPGQLHRGSAGQLAAQTHPRLQALGPLFGAAGLPLALHDDMLPVQWGKLLLNLNNAVNALSGLPLRAQLLDADLRHVTSVLIGEALSLLKAAGIRPARLGAVRPGLLPGVLRLPTPVFRLLARRMLRIDDKARSSMADDLARQRPTEIDSIQGEVLRLAARQGQLAPANARIVQLVRAWNPRTQPISGRGLRRALGV